MRSNRSGLLAINYICIQQQASVAQYRKCYNTWILHKSFMDFYKTFNSSLSLILNFLTVFSYPGHLVRAKKRYDLTKQTKGQKRKNNKENQGKQNMYNDKQNIHFYNGINDDWKIELQTNRHLGIRKNFHSDDFCWHVVLDLFEESCWLFHKKYCPKSSHLKWTFW